MQTQFPMDSLTVGVIFPFPFAYLMEEKLHHYNFYFLDYLMTMNLCENEIH